MMQSRRQFLTILLLAYSFVCDRFESLRSTFITGKAQAEIKEYKFHLDRLQTYGEAFRCRYHYYINQKKKFDECLGCDRLLTMIQCTKDEYRMPDPAYDKKFNFTGWIQIPLYG